jgi:hypothetical protein
MPSVLVEDTQPNDDVFELAHDDPPPPVDDSHDYDGDGERWLTVASFWQSAEAHIARLKLESEQIDCLILDEILVAMDWLFANAVGGIKLQVREKDFAKASQLLHRNHETKKSSEPLYDGQACCPRCGSAEIYPRRFSRRLAFVAILLLGAPLPFLRRGVVCSACGFDWKP